MSPIVNAWCACADEHAKFDVALKDLAVHRSAEFAIGERLLRLRDGGLRGGDGALGRVDIALWRRRSRFA